MHVFLIKIATNLPSFPKQKAQDSDSVYTKQLDSQVMAPGKLTLKIGAQVMLLKNINVSEGLVCIMD